MSRGGVSRQVKPAVTHIRGEGPDDVTASSWGDTGTVRLVGPGVEVHDDGSVTISAPNVETLGDGTVRVHGEVVS